MAINTRIKRTGIIPGAGSLALPGHRLCPKYAFVFREGVRDLVSQVQAPTTAATPGSILFSPTSARGIPGTAREHSATTDRTDLGLDTLLLPTGPVTIVLGWQKTDATNRNAATFGDMGAAAGNCADAYVPFSDGVVYFDWGGQTNGVTRVQVGSLTIGDDVWVFTVGAREMAIYQNGISRVSSAINPTRTQATAQWALGDRGAGSDVSSDLGKYKFVFIYHYQLRVEDIIEISHRPFCWTLAGR